ncbi:hypothetical protein [Lysinibacillus irui]|uniref:Uncharacterized protein n=1 Tax=Lysinibacillus irui TaxID=2998077 RepID=A0AAJ5UYY1_9BACI|nr:hypothetical protein [Lysinibacillus irui]WDV09205.1 hypothetical protein OU989_23240 [Lysinibacillus irui]
MITAAIIFFGLLIILVMQVIALTICGRIVYGNLKQNTKDYKGIIIPISFFIGLAFISERLMDFPI